MCAYEQPQKVHLTNRWQLYIQEPSVPQRASLRIKGIASDGTSVADELRNGQIVVKDSKESSVWGPFPRQEAVEPKPRAMPTGTACCLLRVLLQVYPPSLAIVYSGMGRCLYVHMM